MRQSGLVRIAGRPLGARLGLDFADTDAEIEAAHRMMIPQFSPARRALLREGERRVLARLLAEGPKVVAIGGSC
ncbi:shikimate kinase [Rhizobium leguminosarum]|uniref:shikimate kinase n=1 Tax=Rhizobium leguminosarum TaxID=384 RepID=UPI0028AA14D6|nr:shikimate kinase [Rhizobium leguminosarum]